MRSVLRVLPKQMRLQRATEAGDAEIWIAQIVAECVPDGRTNHSKRTTAVRVELYFWHDMKAAAGRTKVLSFLNGTSKSHPDIWLIWHFVSTHCLLWT